MQEKIYALRVNQTWTLVPRSLQTNIIGFKWVYHTKYNEDGSIDSLKA